MSKQEIQNIINKYNLEVDQDLLLAIIFEMSRFFDKEFTSNLKKIQDAQNIKYNSINRKKLRQQYYYQKVCDIEIINPNLQSYSCTEEDINKAVSDFLMRIQTYDENKIISTINKRIEGLNKKEVSELSPTEWLKLYNKRRRNRLYSFACIKIDQHIFEDNSYDENIITNFIKGVYDDLENYRHVAVVISGELFNRNNEAITWNLLYKAGLYAENFISYTKKYTPFKREKKIKQLSEFLQKRNVNNNDELATNFYAGISTGFKFEDCYIDDKQKIKILILKKIELDDSNIPCPACGSLDQRSNSYPEVFLHSWECSNPNCPERSKSGRGKRFDEYGVYRYFKLLENNKQNIIDEDFYKKWHRDIFGEQEQWTELLIKEYTWAKENILFLNINDEYKAYGRRITTEYTPCESRNEMANTFNELPIKVLLSEVYKNINSYKQGTQKLVQDIEILNGDSSEILKELQQGQIGAAITSPPYYNAREYSQWPDLIMYLIDMMINANSVYNALQNNGYYLYNIGDIVNTDNIYIESNMSNRRQQLGFLSCMIFEIVGYKLVGNIIWDKGEVQSKRNSTVNMAPGYVKCINCYEHVLVFRKGSYETLHNEVCKITPVIKINSKGENTYKHTAPYPLELVSIIEKFAMPKKYILDPFLGSGTTVKWCKQKGYMGVGIEMNDEYYNLCLENINKEEQIEEQIELQV